MYKTQTNQNLKYTDKRLWYRVNGFDISLNYKDRDGYVDEGVVYPRKIQNWIQNGASLTLLGGYKKINTAPLNIPTTTSNVVLTNLIRSMVRYYNASTGTKETLLHISNGVYKLDEATGTFSRIGTFVVSTTYDIEWALDAESGNLYFVDSEHGLMKYNGISISAVTQSVCSIPKHISIYNNRLLLSDDNRVYYSNPSQLETFTANDDFIIPSGKGDVIIRHFQHENGTIIFTTSKVYFVSGAWIEPPAPTIVSHIGAISGKAITNYGNSVFWVGVDKRVHTIRLSTYYELTDNFIGDIPISNSYSKNTCCEIVDGKLWIAYTHNDLKYRFNYKLLVCDFKELSGIKWSGEHEGYRVNCFLRYQAEGDNNEVYFADAYSTTLWQKTDDLYLGVGVTGVVDDSSTTSTEFTIKVSQAWYDTFGLDTEHSLAGCLFTFTSGALKKESSIIAKSTVAVATGDDYNVTVTLQKGFSSAPSDGDSFDIGQINAIYQTGWTGFTLPERIKCPQELYVNTQTSGDYNLVCKVHNDGNDSTREHTISLQSSGSVWDIATFQNDAGTIGDGVWSEDKNLNTYIKDFYVSEEQGKIQSIEFSVTGVNQNATIRGFQYAFTISDALNVDGS